MIKKTIGILVCIILVINFLTIGSSTVKSNNELRSYNQNTVIGEYSGNFCYQYPVMSKAPYFDPQDASPKPEIKDTPDQFSWKDYDGKDWTTPVKNQGSFGCCWDFTAIGTLESMIEIKENCSYLNPDLSEQYVLSCLPEAGGDNYGAIQWVFDCIKNDNSSRGNYCNGIIPESCFPYQASSDIPCSEKCSDWEDYLIPIVNYGEVNIDDYTPEIRDSVKTLIMQNGPLGTYMWASDNFIKWGRTNHGTTDYYPYIYSKLMQNTHTVIIVGWKDDPLIENGGYWICKNSWGTDWGYNGFFNIAYDSLITGFHLYWVDYDPNSYDWPPVADAGEPRGGSIGQEIIFDASRSFDPEDEVVAYHWDFGDGTNGSGTIITHAFSQLGTYIVNLTIIDNGNKTANDTIKVWIQEFNNPAYKPTIEGKSSGAVGKKYDYIFSSIDPEGNDVYYYIDWGDNTFEEWIGPYKSGEEITIAHKWSEQGSYILRAKAKDIFDAESDWALLSVSMPKNKAINTMPLFLRFLQIHPYMFPILRHLLVL